jgi:hypothetical protein
VTVCVSSRTSPIFLSAIDRVVVLEAVSGLEVPGVVLSTLIVVSSNSCQSER